MNFGRSPGISFVRPSARSVSVGSLAIRMLPAAGASRERW
jgi:hypothetical protein